MKSTSVVWAKVKGYPWWPATTDLRHLQQGKSLEESEDKFVVYFIGQTTHAEIPGCKLKLFKECYDKYAHLKNKKLADAVKKAQSILTNMNNPKVVSPIEVHQQQKSCTEDTKTEEHNKQAECSSPGKSELQMQQQPDVFPAKKQAKYAYRGRRAPRKDMVDRIPFRKFEQVSLEGRIVDLLNKMKDQRDCTTELCRVVNKIGKIKPKDIMNRYVLSGLMTVSKLIELKNNIQDKSIINKLCSMITEIKKKAQKGVSDTDCVEDVAVQKQSKADEIMKKNKKNVIRTLYKILKIKLNNNFSESKSLALRLYEYWENNDLICSSKVLTALARMPTEVLRSDGAVVFKHIAGKQGNYKDSLGTSL